MPWKEMSPVNLRMRLVLDAVEGSLNMTELAEQYGISRKTAYKWLARVAEGGPAALEDRSHAALWVANRTPKRIEELVVGLRTEHRTWGPKKLLHSLRRHNPGLHLPSRSTVAEILKRHDLVESKRRPRREGHPGRPSTEPLSPNQIWGADFKGQFKTRDGRYCYPFTVTDLFSRYLLCCDGYLSTSERGVRDSLELAFRENGMPEAIRTYNGSPFASTGIARLTRLAVWLLKLGIRRELIQPGKPTQNGRHERMHKTLKHDALRPPAANLKSQQHAFDSFVDVFNNDRPHEAIGMKRPAELYTSSPRPFPDRLPEPTYPSHFEVRRVSRNGGVRWKARWLGVGHSLVEENIGFEEVEDGIWDAYFMNLRIGRFDERALRLVGTMSTHYRCGKRGDRDSGPTHPRPAHSDLLSSHSSTTDPK